jgi:hypothetical protein
MESARLKEKEKRITLAYRTMNHVNGIFFELFAFDEDETLESRKFKFIGEIENPNKDFEHYHPGNKIERLINQVFEAYQKYRTKEPDFLYSAYPMIDGQVYKIPTENLAA